VGGLLHDIGKLVLLLALPEEYGRISKEPAGIENDQYSG
jgi:HD-like signal output (HDOD) protein